MDVTTTFLYGTLDEDIYMKQPPGFEELGKENMVCHLQKSIYGLKQSSRQWNKCFDTFITFKGFKRNSFGHCVYKKKVHAQYCVLLLSYVDDILMASDDIQEIRKLKQQLNEEFEMEDLGTTEKILGMELKRDEQRQSFVYLSTRLPE